LKINRCNRLSRINLINSICDCKPIHICNRKLISIFRQMLYKQNRRNDSLRRLSISVLKTILNPKERYTAIVIKSRISRKAVIKSLAESLKNFCPKMCTILIQKSFSDFSPQRICSLHPLYLFSQTATGKIQNFCASHFCIFLYRTTWTYHHFFLIN